MEIHVAGATPQSGRYDLPPTRTGRLARFAEVRGERLATQQHSRFPHLRSAAPTETRFTLEQREETVDMQPTAPREAIAAPPTGDQDPFQGVRELGARTADSLRRLASRVRESFSPEAQPTPAQPDSVDADDALAQTAKRPAVAAAQHVEPVLDQNTEPTQVAASGQDATQRLTPDARTRHVRQQDPLSTPTQRFVGFNGTLYMPTAKQPMPGAQMIVGEPGDSALNNAPTTQHPISQPLAQPVQSESGKFPVAAFVAAFPLAGPLALAHKMGLIKYDVIQVLRGGDE